MSVAGYDYPVVQKSVNEILKQAYILDCPDRCRVCPGRFFDARICFHRLKKKWVETVKLLDFTGV